MSNHHVLHQLQSLENDQRRLEEIKQLEDALQIAKKKYVKDYNNVSENLVGQVVQKLKNNIRVKSVVDNYIKSYVNPNSSEAAERELYNIMAAEFLEMLETLNHTSCSVM